jgi:hypothetical protein
MTRARGVPRPKPAINAGSATVWGTAGVKVLTNTSNAEQASQLADALWNRSRAPLRSIEYLGEGVLILTNVIGGSDLRESELAAADGRRWASRL